MFEENDDICLELEEKYKLTDEKAKEIIKNIGKLKNVTDIQKLDKKERNDILKKCKEIDGISVLQLSRITGITRGVLKNI